MILQFLRLFGRFRDIEALVDMQSRSLSDGDEAYKALQADLASCREAYEELTTEKVLLQDRLEAALTDKDRLWSSMQEALANERESLRMQVNHAVQKNGGGIPYPDAHSLPAASIAKVQTPGPVGRSGRLLFSERVQRANREFASEYATVMTPDKA